ncbi:hypothetical protein LXA43DRAFT_208173 [Ganoderma leucocontextum]|nr:hypothetical protein LXA43DRAFT_208173 [Ganoderma leucocontextum]
MVPREAFRPFSKSSKLEVMINGSVFIKHPAVDKSLFCFPAYPQPDPTDASEPLFGVCHPLALDACRVITNHAAKNQADFLAGDREDDPANGNYPIVKEFSAFRFPSRMPDDWYNTRASARGVSVATVVSSSGMSVHVASRDRYCALTGHEHFNRCAHLVPKAEAAWFTANDMQVYSIGNMKAGVDAHTNGVLLRDDVHRCLDAGAFVFYPVRDSDQFMAYFVDYGCWPDYTEQFHRRLATIHPSVAVEFLYARFAYTVINLYRPNVFFDSVPDNDQVRLVEEKMLLEKGGDTGMSQTSQDSRESGGNEESDKESSSNSNQSVHSAPQGSYAEGDERWKERLFGRIPEMATLEEVEHPPDTVDCHSETPHVMRLTSKYMKENPQVWQTSTTPEGATRDDDEGWYAAWMTRPL